MATDDDDDDDNNNNNNDDALSLIGATSSSRRRPARRMPAQHDLTQPGRQGEETVRKEKGNVVWKIEYSLLAAICAGCVHDECHHRYQDGADFLQKPPVS